MLLTRPVLRAALSAKPSGALAGTWSGLATGDFLPAPAATTVAVADLSDLDASTISDTLADLAVYALLAG